MYALDAMTSAELWRFSTKPGDSSGHRSSTARTCIQAAATATSTPLTPRPVSSASNSRPAVRSNASPTLAGGIIYLVNQASQMYTVDPGPGTRCGSCPSTPVPRKGRRSPTVSHTSGPLLAASMPSAPGLLAVSRPAPHPWAGLRRPGRPDRHPSRRATTGAGRRRLALRFGARNVHRTRSVYGSGTTGTSLR